MGGEQRGKEEGQGRGVEGKGEGKEGEGKARKEKARKGKKNKNTWEPGMGLGWQSAGLACKEPGFGFFERTQYHRLDAVVHACNTNTLELQAGGSGE